MNSYAASDPPVSPIRQGETGSKLQGNFTDLRQVCYLFLASKGLIILIALVAPLFFHGGDYYLGRATEIGWEKYFKRWDSGWYIDVARHGYSYHSDGTGSVVFFPLFPLILRGFMRCGLSPEVSGPLIANGCFLFALWFFFQLTLAEFQRRPLAQHATALLAFCPGLAWFSIGYTESLFLLLSLLVFWLLHRQRLWSAAAAGVLAGLSRPTAVVLIAPLFCFLAPAMARFWREKKWKEISVRFAVLVSTLAGHAMFLVYLQVQFGSWRVLHIAESKGWDSRVEISWQMLLQKIPGIGLHLFDNVDRAREYVAWSWLLVLVSTLFCLISFWERRTRFWLPIFLIGFVGLYGAIEQLGGPLYAIARYCAPLFPFYIGLALYAENRPWAQTAAISAMTAGNTITTLMVFAGYHIN